MYEIDGVEYTQNDVDYNAKLQGLTSEEWLKQNGFTASEGKTNGSTETPPTEPVKNTAAGDSSSADISLESPGVNEYITAEDLAQSEFDVSKMLNKKLSAIGLYTEESFGKNGKLDAINIKRRVGYDAGPYMGSNTFFTNPIKDILKSFSWSGGDSKEDLGAQAKSINAEINRLKNDNYLTEAQERSGKKYAEYKIATTPDALSTEEATKLYEEDRDYKFSKIKRFRDNKGFDVSFENGDFESAEEEAQYKKYLEGSYIAPPAENELKAWEEARNEGYASKESLRFTNDLDKETRLDLEAIAANEQAVIKTKVDNLSKIYKEQAEAYESSFAAYKENPTENNRLVAFNDFENIQATISGAKELAKNEEGLPLAIRDFGANYSRLQQLTSNVKGLGADMNYQAAQLAGIMGYPEEYVQGALDIATEVKKEQGEFQRSLGVDEIKSIGDAGSWLASSTTSLLPSLGMAATGPFALPLFFMSGAGSTGVDNAIKEKDAVQRMLQNKKLLEENTELDELERIAIEDQMTADSKILNIPEWRKLTAQVWNGLAEVVFEKTGTLFLLKSLKQGAKLLPPATVKEGFKKLGTSVGKGLYVEGGSEWATNTFQNFADIYILDEDKSFFDAIGDEKLFEGGLETLAQGALMGGGMAVGGNLNAIKEATVSEIATKAENKKIAEIVKKLEALTGVEGLTNASNGIPLPAQTPEVQKLVEQLTGEADYIKNNALARIGDDLSIEDLKAVGEINRKMRKTSSDFSRLMSNGDLGAAQLKAIETEYRGEFNKLAEEREGILTNENLSKETLKITSGNKIRFDAQTGYQMFNQRMLNESIVGITKEWNNIRGSERTRMFSEAKAQLEKNLGASTATIPSAIIENKARENFIDSKYAEKIQKGKENVENYIKSNDLNVEIVEVESAEAIETYLRETLNYSEAEINKAFDRQSKDAALQFTTEGLNIKGENGAPDIIIVDKNASIKNKRIGVYAHELLHSIALQQSNSKDVNAAGENLLNYLEKNQPDLYTKVKNRVDSSYAETNENGEVTKQEAYFEEVLNAMSDILADGQVVDKNFLLQARTFVNSWFPKSMKLSSDEATYQFIRGFNKKAHFGGKGAMQNFGKAITDDNDDTTKEEKAGIIKVAKDNLREIRKTATNIFKFSRSQEFESSNKADLFSATVGSFNEATELYGLDIKLREDGTPAFTKAEWDAIPENTKLGLGFMIGETWKPYVNYLMGTRRDVPGFDEYANQIVDRTSTGIERGDDGIPFLIKTYNPEAGAKLSSYIFGQVGRRLQGAINKQDGFGEITVDAVSDKPGAKELVQEETLVSVDDAPKYKNLIRRRVITPVAMANIESKIIPILRVLKTRMDASVSKNVTSKPWVNELRLQLGKQLDLIIKQEMGGVKGGELRRFLLNNKTAILENMTTSYLTKAMPFAVQKSVSGVYTSNWQGQKIDRETTDTQKAGRTSGNELVRRLPKASIRISDAEFLAAVVGPGGNPIRGRKEALAKAIAEETALDMILEGLKDSNSKISEAFVENQKRLGVEVDENIERLVSRDFERGVIKQSRSREKIINQIAEGETKLEIDFIKKYGNNLDNTQEYGYEINELRIAKSQLQQNNYDELLATFGYGRMPDLLTEDGRKDVNTWLTEIAVPKLYKGALSGPQGGSAYTSSQNVTGKTQTKKEYEAYRDNTKAILKSKKYGPQPNPVNGYKIDGKTKAAKSFAKNGVNWMSTNANEIEKANEINMAQYRALLTRLFELVKENPDVNLPQIAKFLQLASNYSGHIHRNAARFVGWDQNYEYGQGKGVLEHAMTSSNAAVHIISAMARSSKKGSVIDFEAEVDTIMRQYTLLALSKPLDNQLVGWLKNNMPKGWDINTSTWVARYIAGGIDLSQITMLNGKPLSDLLLTPEGLAFVQGIKGELAKESFNQITADHNKYKEIRTKEISESIKASRTKAIEGSADLSVQINEMIERATGISTEQTFADIDARMKGKNIGKYKFFAPGADDFRGLTSYTFAGKGKQGEADQKFFEDNLVKPYQRGISSITRAKQTVKNDFAFVVKSFPKQAKMMSEKVPGTEYTYDQALRVYLWQRQGMEVPGIKPETVRNLSRAISSNLGLIEFANATLLASKQGEWMAPSKFWATETVLSGLYNMTENLGRKVYLAEFIENADIIFSPENLNKMEALYGSKYRSALEDSLYRMKNGTNRNSGSDATTNRWNNWVNQSTGAIMFFNRRSAVLQTLSIANFTNWSDNNPIKQAMAFANQKQYWADFAMIFNSPKLKERRSGLKNDVNASEIASAVKGETNKAAAALNKILELGFKPTQIADSFAIASGGAAFYRNRVNTYLKQDMSLEAAEKLAFEEFSSNADESQQSSDPMLVAQQQASVLGRLVLAFQNTPMQYTRLMKKAGQDIINGRGDFKTNMSKILYYGAVQNLIFSTLQSALFAFIPGFMDDEDDDKRDQKLETKQIRILNSMIDSLLKGSGLTGAVLATVKNSVLELNKQMDRGFLGDPMYVALQVLGISPPIGSKMRKLYSAYQTYRFEKDALQRGASIVADGRLNFSPWYSIAGNVASATFSVPGDRVIDEITSISEALDSRNTQWQRLALAMGWKTWDVGAKNEEHDLLKVAGKKKRKAQGKVKSAKTRATNKKSNLRNQPSRNQPLRNQSSRRNIKK